MGALEDKIVVVAGASAGMGKAVARRCADEGAEVVMLARGSARLAAAAAEVGPRAVPLRCDIADPDSVREAFDRISDRFGRIDALLNIAGVARIRSIEHATDDDISLVFGVNLLGPVHTTRAAIPLLRASGGGDIVYVSSEIVDDYLPRMVLYGASKGGLDVFARQMGHELKSEGIRVTRFTSGSVADTGFGDNFDPAEIAEAYPEWEASGYLTRVAGPGMDAAWMADAFLFLLTRPRQQMIDVIRVRSFAPGAAEPSGLTRDD